MVESNTTLQRQLPSRTTGEMVSVASIYMAISCSIGIIYGIVLLVMIKTKNIRQYSSYKIMIVMGFSDLLQLLLTGPLCSVFTLVRITIGRQVKIVGAMMMGTYYTSCLLITILALERCAKTWSPRVAWQKVFGEKKLYFWFILSALNAISLVIYWTLGPGSVYYIPAFFTWNYIAPFGAVIFDKVMMYGASVILIGCYGMILLKIKMMSKLTTTIDPDEAKRERSILYQCIATVGNMLVMVSIWTWAARTGQTSAVVWVLCQVSSIMNAGFNGVIYLIFNATLKQELKRMFYKTGTQVVPIGINNHS